MPSRVAGLTRGTIVTAPSVCRECVWWQSRGNRTASKERWIEKVEAAGEPSERFPVEPTPT